MIVFQADTTEMRTLNDPRVNDWESLDDYLGGDMRPSSGVRVSRETAFKLSGYWRGVNLIANVVAKLPLRVRRIVEGGGEEDATDHPAYDLLMRQSSDEHRAKTLKQTLAGHAVGLGNGYAYIGRRRTGRPFEILPLLPDRTYPMRVNGRLVYVTTLGGTLDDPSSTPIKLRPEQVLHFRGLGFDGIMGYSLLRMASEGLGLGIAQQQYGAAFFANAATPKFTVESPNRLSDQAYSRLQKTWHHMKTGLSEAHKAVILEEGAKANPLTINPSESQLLESREFDLVTVANYLQIPPHKLGVKGYTSNSTLEQSNQEAADDAYDPWLVEFETECEAKLLTDEEKSRRTHTVNFDRRLLHRANLDARAAYYRTALGGRPWMSQWEARVNEGLDPRIGDTSILDPLNMGSLAASSDGGTISKKTRRNKPLIDRYSPVVDGMRELTAEEELRSIHRDIVKDAVGRMCRRVAADAARHAEPAKWAKFVEKFASDHAEKIIEALQPSEALCSVSISEWLVKEMTACTDQQTLANRLNDLPDESLSFVE